MLDCYRVLGLAPDASQQAIRKAYHSAVLQLHPDKQTGRVQQHEFNYQQVQKAWQVDICASKVGFA